MDNLAHSEIFALTLVIGTYLTSLALYKKVHISLLHPLLTTIFVIIVVLEVLGIQYESFQQSSHLIHFMLGPSVVALGYVLYEQIQYLKGNVVSILTSRTQRFVYGISACDNILTFCPCIFFRFVFCFIYHNSQYSLFAMCFIITLKKLLRNF